MVWLCGLLPYNLAASVMQRIGKRQVSDSSLWRMTQAAAPRLLTLTAADHSATAPESSSAESTEPSSKLLSLDGGMVNIWGEGWKELKVALVGRVKADEPPSSNIVAEVHTQVMRYAAVLGDVDAFRPSLLDLARCTGFEQAARSCVTADGAAWIWNLADTYFPRSVQILDYYHARQHLSLAAQTLFSDQPALATAWFEAHTADLFEGHLQPIISELEQAGLADMATYFHTHAARMTYADFRDEAYPLGSGSVESEVKQFKQRLAGPGMCWSRPGAEHIILIRAAVLDDSFDARWSQAA